MYYKLKKLTRNFGPRIEFLTKPSSYQKKRILSLPKLYASLYSVSSASVICEQLREQQKLHATRYIVRTRTEGPAEHNKIPSIVLSTRYVKLSLTGYYNQNNNDKQHFIQISFLNFMPEARLTIMKLLQRTHFDQAIGPLTHSTSQAGRGIILANGERKSFAVHMVNKIIKLTTRVAVTTWLEITHVHFRTSCP